MYFGGSYFDYDEDKLSDNPTLAAHFVHSIMHLAHDRGKIYWRKGMTINEVFQSNKDFLVSMQERYRKERGYTIDPNTIKTALSWFVQRMGNMEVEE